MKPKQKDAKAIQMVYLSLQQSPLDLALWTEFAHLFRFIQFSHVDGRLKRALTRSLEMAIPNHQDVVFASVSLLNLDPDFKQVINLIATGQEGTGEKGYF